MLPRSHRLKRAGAFQSVYRSGRSYAEPLLVLHVVRDRPGSAQVGMSVSKKVGCAVVRNRLKRRLRAIVAAAGLQDCPGCWIVLKARSGAATAPFAELEAAVRRLWQRAGLGASSNVDKDLPAS